MNLGKLGGVVRFVFQYVALAVGAHALMFLFVGGFLLADALGANRDTTIMVGILWAFAVYKCFEFLSDTKYGRRWL